MMDRPIKKKKWVRKVFYGLVLIGGVVFLTGYHFLYQDNTSKLNVNTQKIIISTVSKDSFQEFIPALGKVETAEMVYLDAMEGGRVEKKFVEAGASVKKGDKLIKLSNTDLVLKLMQQEAEYFNQRDNLQKARLSMEQNRLDYTTLLNDLDYQIKTEKRLYDENRVLFEKKIISKTEYIKVKERYEYLIKKKQLATQNYKQETHFRQVQIEQQEASINRMGSNLDIIKEKLENLTIIAPIDGQLTVFDAEIGESKKMGERLGQINVMKNLLARVEIDEHYISRIEKGNIGTFEFAGETSKLKIQKIFPEVRENQFEVEMTFIDKPPEGVRIGQTLHIKLVLGDSESVVRIPRGGFYQSTAGQWVYVIDESGNFAVKRKTRLGRQNSDFFEVLEGLTPGEKIITSNYDSFENMDKLVLK